MLRYANAARWQGTIRDNCPRPSRLDPYKPYLERRFAEGCISVTRLHGELVAERAPVTYGMVRAHIATLRGAPSAAPPRPPTVRQATGWITRHPTALAEEDRAGLKDVLARCPELETATGHVRDFGEILTDRLGATLPTWIDAVDAGRLPGLTGFALQSCDGDQLSTRPRRVDLNVTAAHGTSHVLPRRCAAMLRRRGVGAAEPALSSPPQQTEIT